MINTEEFFPSLAGPTKTVSAPTNSTPKSIPGAWGKPKDWSSPPVKNVEKETTIINGETKPNSSEKEPKITPEIDLDVLPTKPDIEEGKEHDTYEGSTPKEILEHEDTYEGSTLDEMMDGCVPLGCFSVEEIREIIRKRIPAVKINFVPSIRYTCEKSDPTVAQVEATGFIPSANEKKEVAEASATFASPVEVPFTPSAQMMHPPYYQSYTGYPVPYGDVYYYSVYGGYQPQWYPH
mmetsp:Transcript_48237/g.73426  ORF Transcript_48237/g.73426 Transcript_48237/m.73426 type:complete len:236 (+) Transcript_48237:839-1546(+)